MMKKITAEPLLMINELETLKVVTDPLRLKIYQTVSNANQEGMLCSVKQIADALDIPQAKLYYHIKQLENQDLLVVGKTRIVSGIVEKLYRVRAYRIMVANDLFITEAGKEAVFPLFSEMISNVHAEMQALLQKPEGKARKKYIAISQQTLRLPADKIHRFAERLEELLKEVEAEESQTSGENMDQFTLFAVIYPEVKKDKGTKTFDDD